LSTNLSVERCWEADSGRLVFTGRETNQVKRAMKGGYHVWLSDFPCEMMVLCATDIFEAILYNKAALCLISNKKIEKRKRKH